MWWNFPVELTPPQKFNIDTYLDLPFGGVEWMMFGVPKKPSLRVQTAPFARCWYLRYLKHDPLEKGVPLKSGELLGIHSSNFQGCTPPKFNSKVCD